MEIKNSHQFFANKECRYYPCHKGVEPINCLFCFCPLYPYHDCGGNYSLTKKGIKDCSSCTWPHKPEHYDLIIEKFMKKNRSAGDDTEG